MSKKFFDRVPAKVIFLGEHFVVHGTRAISAAVDLFVEGEIVTDGDEKIVLDYIDHRETFRYDDKDIIVQFVKEVSRDMDIDVYPEIWIRFGFPTSAGLGSSASLAYLIVKLLNRVAGDIYGGDELFKLAERFETMVHGNPSGVDLTTVANGGFILFKRDRGIIDRIDRDVFRGYDILLIDSMKRRSTGVIVSRVTEYLKMLDGDIREGLLNVVDEMVGEGWEKLSNGDIEGFTDIMMSNHYLLKYIGVYNRSLDDIVRIFHRYGVKGVKVTGAGGGGCILALVRSGVSDEIAKDLKKRGYPVYKPKIYFWKGIR